MTKPEHLCIHVVRLTAKRPPISLLFRDNMHLSRQTYHRRVRYDQLNIIAVMASHQNKRSIAAAVMQRSIDRLASYTLRAVARSYRPHRVMWDDPLDVQS